MADADTFVCCVLTFSFLLITSVHLAVKFSNSKIGGLDCFFLVELIDFFSISSVSRNS